MEPEGAAPLTSGGKRMIAFLVATFLVVVVGSFPATWLLMLFLGNIGTHVSFWGVLPAGILITFFVAGTGGLSRVGRRAA